jgi:hypothetical protein
MTSKADLQQWWGAAAANGGLVPAKHQSASTASAASQFRTVISAPASSSLQPEIQGGAFVACELKYSNHPTSCYVVAFSDPRMTPAGFGIPAGATAPNNAPSYDRFLFKSGSNGQWEAYCVSSQEIHAQISSGSITVIRSSIV